MAENYNYDLSKTKKSTGGWWLIFLLFLSFCWVELYPSIFGLDYGSTVSYGNLFDMSNPYLSQIVMVLLVEALFDLILFELLFYIYRFVLSFRIYSFVVPVANLKAETRTFFIYRNLIYGIFVNICFLFPYLYSYLGLISLIVTMAFLIVYVLHLNSKYGENIIGHFVFKNFCYPIFIFEAVSIFLQIVEVM